MKCLEMKVHKNGQALKTWQNITLLFIELTLPMGFPKIFFNVKMKFLDPENAYVVQSS